MKRKYLILTLLATLTILLPLFHALETHAYAGAKMYADPSVKLAGINETYTFDVRLQNASRVTTIAFSLSFDPTKVNITKIEIGDALPGGHLFIGDWNSAAGTITDITTMVLGTHYDVYDSVVVTITVETRNPAKSVLIDIWDMACWTWDLDDLLSGDCLYDHTVSIIPSMKVGVLAPMTWNQGQGMLEGAEIARDEINSGTGISGFPVELVFADTLRGGLYPNSSSGIAAATELVNAGCSFVVGGYWSDSVLGAREVLMDNKTVFAVTGVPDDTLMDAVRTNYARYKYLFRVAPTNLTTQAQVLLNFSRSTFAANPVKIAVIAENIAMWDSLYNNLTNATIYTRPDVLGPLANVTYCTRVPLPTKTAYNFTNILLNINASGAQYVIDLFASETSINFIKQWRELAIKVMPVGISMESQNPEFWYETQEKCDGETIIADCGSRTPLSRQSLEFYDETVRRYGRPPISTAYGAYDAIFTVKEAIERAGSINSDAIVSELEKTDRVSTRGRFMFTANHDVFCNEIGANWTNSFVRPLVSQWRPDPLYGGRREVVFPKYGKAAVFARKWSTPIWINPIADDDLNPNGQIDIYDAIAFASNYGKKAGDAGWNLECDFDGNGIIDIADASRLEGDFGKNSSSRMSEKAFEADSHGSGIAEVDSNTLIYLTPPTINGTEVGLGHSVTVDINIGDAIDVCGWQVSLTFNASLLECTQVTISDEFLQNAGGDQRTHSGSVNNSAGEIRGYGADFLGPYRASGSGRLMYVTFMVKDLGTSDIHLCDVMAMDYWGSRSWWDMVPFQIVDTYTLTQYASWKVLVTTNSTGESTMNEVIDDDPVNFMVGSGLYDHAFNRTAEMLHFNATGPCPGHLNATIPKTLILVDYSDQLLPVVDNIPLRTNERTITENSTHYFVYFDYAEQPHSVQIQRRPPVYNVDVNSYYATIQSAINSNTTLEGHTVMMFAGTCNESVLINKSISLIGEHSTNTTIDGKGTGTVVKITANDVNLSSFTIRNSKNLQSGILIQGSNGSRIDHNTVTNCTYGILVNCSSNIVLNNNNMSGNRYNFGLYGETDAQFDNTIDSNNKADGKSILYIKDASDAIYNASADAATLYLVNCNNITVKDITLSKNIHGIYLRKTTATNIQNITSQNNTIGICLDNSSNNIIFHNSFIWNNVHATAKESYGNAWNDTYPSGGNYWSDYEETDYYHGPNQDLINNDGILDQPYVIDPNNCDNYPLISPLEPPVYNTRTNLGYSKIQDAINAAKTSSGHRVIVRAGTYADAITISKSLTLIGIHGYTIINATGTSAVTITANNVLFRDFTIDKSTPSSDKAILVNNANGTTIRDNIIAEHNYSVYLSHAYNCYIGGNVIASQLIDGVHLEYSSYNTISRNDLTGNVNGITLTSSDNNDICRNNVTGSTTCGINLISSSSNLIYHNNFINTLNAAVVSSSINNKWDNGYPSGGNHWSNQVGADEKKGPGQNETGSDGINDVPYTVYPGGNIDHYPLNQTRGPFHNINVASCTPSKTSIGQGYFLNVTVTVLNEGDDVEMFDLTISTPARTKRIAVAAEDTATIVFTWNTTGVPMNTYTTGADATSVPNEYNVSDNHLMFNGFINVTIVGDMGNVGDNIFKVGPYDFALLSKAFGSTPWHPGMGGNPWNPNCDVNCDNIVGSADFALLAANFGKHYP